MNALVRTKKEIKNHFDNHRQVVDAFLESRNIPIYYQRLQPENAKKYYPMDKEALIGVVDHFYEDTVSSTGEEAIYAHITLNPLNPYAAQFEGKIDNFGLGLVKDKGKKSKHYSMKVLRCFVYNRMLKKKVDKKMSNENQTKDQNDETLSVCMEIAAAESIPELNKEAPKAE